MSAISDRLVSSSDLSDFDDDFGSIDSSELTLEQLQNEKLEQIQGQMTRIGQKLPAQQSLFTAFPFQNAAEDFSVETDLFSHRDTVENCIKKVFDSTQRIVFIPLVLTTKAQGKEFEEGWFEHWKNHIVGVAVDKAHKTIEYYDPQGKVLEKEARRLLLSNEIVDVQAFVSGLQKALVAQEPVDTNEPVDTDEFTLLSSAWQIISNPVRHQGILDQKTCGYRVAHFFQERLSEAAPGGLFTATSPLVGKGYEHRAYVEGKLSEAQDRLKMQLNRN